MINVSTGTSADLANFPFDLAVPHPEALSNTPSRVIGRCVSVSYQGGNVGESMHSSLLIQLTQLWLQLCHLHS